jgi:hypothetical protein
MELLTLKCLFPFGALPTNWGWLAVASQDRGLLFPECLPSGSTPPPEFKANCSRSALSLLGFTRATRGSGQFCVCHGIRGLPEIYPFSTRFDSVLLSVGSGERLAVCHR